MNLTRSDWNKIFLLQQNRVEVWERLANNNDNNLYKAMLQEELELLEKIREEMNKCKK